LKWNETCVRLISSFFFINILFPLIWKYNKKPHNNKATTKQKHRVNQGLIYNKKLENNSSLFIIFFDRSLLSIRYMFELFFYFSNIFTWELSSVFFVVLLLFSFFWLFREEFRIEIKKKILHLKASVSGSRAYICFNFLWWRKKEGRERKTRLSYELYPQIYCQVLKTYLNT